MAGTEASTIPRAAIPKASFVFMQTSSTPKCVRRPDLTCSPSDNILVAPPGERQIRSRSFWAYHVLRSTGFLCGRTDREPGFDTPTHLYGNSPANAGVCGKF